jgi:hypothetical protein
MLYATLGAMNSRIFDILRKTGNPERIEKISFSYEGKTYDKAELFVWCFLHRFPDTHCLSNKRQSVLALAGTEDEALDAALAVLNDVMKLEETITLPSGDKEQQQWNKGYYRKIVKDNFEVEWRRENDEFFITRVNQKDPENFYIVKKPFPVPAKWKHLSGNLYEWDDIGFLCGSRGLAVVENGLVIKTKTIAIS